MPCLQNVDTESMSLILTGLARCGAWGCFDEFNRLQEATLSSISMLIQPIQSALKDKADSVQIGDRQVRIMINDHTVQLQSRLTSKSPKGAFEFESLKIE